jgi:hypothetical protein
MHYARWAADDANLQYPDRIDAESMRRAVTLTEWFKAEARRVYGLLSETDEERDRRQLADWIAKRGGAVTARELQQGHRQYRTAEDAVAALEDLAEARLGTWQPVPPGSKGGRPYRVFRLSTASTVYTTPENPAGNGGSVDVDSADDIGTQHSGSHAEAVNRLLAEAAEGDRDGYTTCPDHGENGSSEEVASVAGPETQDDQWGEI